jgi:hypothetical protein
VCLSARKAPIVLPLGHKRFLRDRNSNNTLLYAICCCLLVIGEYHPFYSNQLAASNVAVKFPRDLPTI